MKRIFAALLCLIALAGCAGTSQAPSDPTPSQPQAVLPEKLKLDREELFLLLGSDPVEITYTVAPADATVTDTTWRTSDKTVATVQDGVITPVGEGVCTVTLILQTGLMTDMTVTVQDSEYFAPAIAFDETDGCTYIDGVLIANKTYPLPAGYNPGGILPQVMNAWNDMVDAAARDGIALNIISGFRDYGTQESIYNDYVSANGQAEADTYSARPGHSEHQTGLAFDINEISNSFGETPAGKWVDEHAADYGFIIRYPKDKQDITGYIYEPWHLRYLGTELAIQVKDSGLCLEEYFNITSAYQE